MTSVAMLVRGQTKGSDAHRSLLSWHLFGLTQLSPVESGLTGPVIGSVGVRISVAPHRKGRNELPIHLLWGE